LFAYSNSFGKAEEELMTTDSITQHKRVSGAADSTGVAMQCTCQ